MPDRFDLSLSPLTVLPCSPLELIEAAAEAGYAAVGLRLQPVLPSDVDVMADPQLMRAIERRLASTNLRVLDVEVFRIGPHTDVAAMVPALSYAGALGARFIQITALGLAEYRDEDEPTIVGKIAQLCELAARHQIRPVLEFMAFRGIRSLDDALRIAARVDHPSLGILVDALHLQRSGGTPAALAKVDRRLPCYVQLCDAPAAAPADLMHEARYGRLYPGEGELPLRQLLEALPPQVAVSVEAPNSARYGLPPTQRAIDGVRWTQDLLAQVKR